MGEAYELDGTLIRLKLYVKTMRPETKLVSEPDNTLTLHLAAPPTKGKANRAIVKWLAKRLELSSSQVRIVIGIHSNSKVVEISGTTRGQAAMLLGIDPVSLTEI